MINRVTVSGLRLRPRSSKITTTPSAATALALPLQQSPLPLPLSSYSLRRYATHHQQSTPESRRRAVTPFNDDGRVPWTELSAGEKTGRAAQQTFNFGMVIVGLALTVR